MAQTCSKTFLSLLNCLLIIFGIALIIFSFNVYHKYQSVQLLTGVIIIAFFVLFVGLLGLIGGLKQSKCALSVYIVLVGLVTLALLVVLIVLCLRRSWAIDKFIGNYENYLTNTKSLDDEINLNVTRALLMKLQCCGFKTRNEPQKVFKQMEFCQSMNQSKPLCSETMKNDLEQNLNTIIILHAVLTGLGAFACIAAFHLACTTNNQRRHPTFQSRYY